MQGYIYTPCCFNNSLSLWCGMLADLCICDDMVCSHAAATGIAACGVLCCATTRGCQAYAVSLLRPACMHTTACIQLTTLLDSAADCTSCDVQLTYVTCARYLCFLCLPMMCVLAYVCFLAVLFGSGGIFNNALGSCIVRVAVLIAAVLLSFSLGLGFACRTIM